MKHINILKHNLMRAAMTLALIVTCATAWAQNGNWSSYKAASFSVINETNKTLSITNEAELALLASSSTDFTGYTITLTRDLNMSAHYWDKPIGNSSNKFRATFDGGSHTISGINITGNSSYQGLFGYVGGTSGSTGTVRNLTLASSTISGSDIVGGIAGYIYNGTVSNCHVLPSVTIQAGGDDSDYHGGIVGQTYPNGNNTSVTIENCTCGASITSGSYSNCSDYGGIVGYYFTNNNVTLTNCFYYGTSISANSYVGAIVGYCWFYNNCSPGISNCYYHYPSTISGFGDGNSVASVMQVYQLTLGAGTTYLTISGTSTYNFNGTHYYAADATATVATTDNTLLIESLSASSGSISNVVIANDWLSATFTMGSGDVTLTATLYQSVSYIDADGTTKICTDYTVLTGSESSLGSHNQTTWYVVNSDISYNGSIECVSNVNIILADDKTMTVNGGDNYAFTIENALTIYGQSGQSGTLNASTSTSNEMSGAIYSNGGSFVVNGGTINVTCSATGGRGIHTKYLTINGGTVTVDATYGIRVDQTAGNIAINGGNVTVNGNGGIQASFSNITLSWKNATDRIYAKQYSVSNNYTISIAEGKYFKDASGNFYFGNVGNSINDKTLQPATQTEYIQACLGTGNDGSAEHPYTINDANGWNAFCLALEDKDTWNGFSGKIVKLGANITVTRIAGSGSGGNLTANDHPFCGTFDGYGKTLTFNYGSSGTPADENNLAPFRYVNNATIQHLRVAGTIYTKHVHTGGIVGQAYGTTNITDCRSSVNIVSSINGDGTHGGIMSCSWTGSTTNISGCLFDGSIQSASGYTTNQCGGFVGWKNATINVINSLLTADLNTIATPTGLTYPSATFVRNGVANDITNCYYVTAFGTVQGKERRSITADQYVTVANAGTATAYATTGITSYGTGIKYNNVLYAGSGDEVSLTLGNTLPEGYVFNGYTVSPDGATLTGSGNNYTLTMPNADVTIGADFCYSLAPTLLALVDNSITAHGATLNWSGYSDSYSVMVGKADTPTTFQTIDFATGDFSQGNFSFTTDYHFEVYSATNTNKAARSTNYHKNNSTSDMVLQVTIPAAGTLQFQAAVSSQEDHDKAYFSIDGSIQSDLNGISGPYTSSTNTNYEYTLTAGTHTLRWYYTKDDDGKYDNQDRFMVDDIIIKVLVPSSWDEYTANATSITLNDLDPSTLYMAKVIGKCGSNGQSEPSNAIYFTTGQETFTKDIAAHGEGNGGWYLIASPLADPTDATDVTNLANTDDNDGFDLYRFNQAADAEWENWKQEGDHYHFNLESGRGYLYANSEDVTLTFTGTPYSGESEVTLNYTEGAELAGWNLVGNPFAVEATLDQPYYRMNEQGSALKTETESTSVAAMEGVFVKADEEGQTVTFEAQTRGSKQAATAQANIMVVGSDGTLVDNAIVRFDGGQTLEKFSLRQGSTKLYIPQGGKDYAVVYAENQGEMPVSFKAGKNGQYTITVNPEGVEMSYLHLIDNMTGADVDLLSAGDRGSEPAMRAEGASYTFNAKVTDYESRFKLVFSANNEDGPSTGSATFAFYSNGDWIIANPSTGSGVATLQVIDALGRMLSSEEIHSALTTSNASHFRIPNSAFPTPGVYVLRLINGENVKTQKIVIP